MDDLAARDRRPRMKVRAPFSLATCGWVLGPQQDRAMFDKVLPKDVAVSCINRQVGYTPVDARLRRGARAGRSGPFPGWRTIRRSARRSCGRAGCGAMPPTRCATGATGLMGIHWRTRALGPNVCALAQAAWDQEGWAPAYEAAASPAELPRVAGPVGGEVAAFPNNPIAGTTERPLYQTVRYNLSAYHLPATNGPCTR